MTEDAGGIGRRALLDDAAVEAGLDGLAWTRDGAALTRELRLPSFREAISFVGRVAEVAEAMDHHPDIDIRWRTVRLRVTTNSAGGITAMDLEFARRIDGLITDAA